MRSLAVFCWLTAGGAVELLLRLLVVNSAVRAVLVTSGDDVVVPAVPSLLLILHAAVTPRLYGGRRGRGLVRTLGPLMAVCEGILVLPAHCDN